MLHRHFIWLLALVFPLTLLAQETRPKPAPAKLAAPRPAGETAPEPAPAPEPNPVAPAAPEKSAPTAAPAPAAPAVAPTSGAAPTTGAPAAAASQRPNTEGQYVPNKARLIPLPQVNVGGPIYVFPFEGEFDGTQESFFRRAFKDAEKAGASAMIIEMNTPGGSGQVLMDMQAIIDRVKFPVLTFVKQDAFSAGALLALGTKRIYMRPTSVIGAAAVVNSNGMDLEKTMKSKIDSAYTAKIRGVCEANGYNPDIGEAFMVLERELKVGDTVIDGPNTLLSLNGREAAKIYDGKPLLTHGLVESVEEVIKAEGLTGTVVRVQQSGFESFAFWITQFSYILIIGGIIGGYIEMKAPGFGLPGICSIICFALYFTGHYIAGLAGYEAPFFFIIGVVLILVEFFLLPGTFIPGLVGTLMILGSILWAMVDYWPSSPGLPSAADFQRPMTNLLIAILGTSVCIAILARFLPKTALYRRLVLTSTGATGAAVSVPVVNLNVRPGDVGAATTVLRPAGKALIQGEVHDVLTNGEFLPAGTPIRVLETDGLQVLVERAG